MNKEAMFLLEPLTEDEINRMRRDGNARVGAASCDFCSAYCGLEFRRGWRTLRDALDAMQLRKQSV